MRRGEQHDVSEPATTRKLGRLLDSFHSSTGLAVALRPGHGVSRCPLGRVLAQTSRGRSLCRQCLGRFPARLTGCPAGLQPLALPVRVDGQTVATLLAGPVFHRAPTAERLRRLLAALHPDAAHARQLRAVYFGMACLSPRQRNAHRAMLKLLAGELARELGRYLPAARAGEPDCIRRARQIAHAQHAGPLTMRDVARQVHHSPQHFCRQFRKHTGQSFLDYVARVRVAKAQALLVDRRLLMKQIAGQSGFSSAVRFNHIFKKITGQSPTEYRRALR